MRRTAKTRHLYREVHGLQVYYREAGVPSATAVLLLHGFPNSSYSFREVLPTLGEHVYAVAPDLPGFGFSDKPPLEEYTFERLSQVVDALVDELGVERYVLYVTDFGTPVGYLMAMRHPQRVLGIVVQNGNTLYPRESWHLDWDWLSRPGNIDAQFQLFNDYRHHVARFAEIEAYHKEHQPPCLVVWGRHDTYFGIEEVLAYHKDMATLDVHVYDSGHQLLETHAAEVAALLVTFVRDVLDRAEVRS